MGGAHLRMQAHVNVNISAKIYHFLVFLVASDDKKISGYGPEGYTTYPFIFSKSLFWYMWIYLFQKRKKIKVVRRLGCDYYNLWCLYVSQGWHLFGSSEVTIAVVQSGAIRSKTSITWKPVRKADTWSHPRLTGEGSLAVGARICSKKPSKGS